MPFDGLFPVRSLENSSLIRSFEIIFILSTFSLIALYVSSSGEKPCELTNLHNLNIRNGSSEKDIIGLSGVVIVPFDRSFIPPWGSTIVLSTSEKAIALMVKSLLDRSKARSETDSIDGFLDAFS